MEKILSLLLLARDIYNFLLNFERQHSYVKIYKPTMHIKIYSDLFESKFANYYIKQLPNTKQLILKPVNKKINSKNKYVLYDLIKRKPFILNGSELNNFEYITNFNLFIALLESKTDKIINKIAVENRLQLIFTINKKIECYDNSELELLYKQFSHINKDKLQYFEQNNLILLDSCKIINDTYNESVYLSSIIDIVLDIYIPIDFENNFCKSNKFNKEENLNLITSFITDKTFQYKPNDKFKYFKTEYSCFVGFEENNNCECIITVDFTYNNLLNLLLFIDFLETLQYL